MGASLSWIALKCNSLKLVENQLGLKEVIDSEGVRKKGIFEAFNMNNGWIVVVGGEPIERFLPLGELSKEVGLFWCEVEEHINYSAAAYWQEGTKKWELEHHPERSGDFANLKLTGRLPEHLAEISNRLIADQGQADCDMVFEAAIEIGEVVTGFRHDIVLDEFQSTLLEPVSGGLVARALEKINKGCRASFFKLSAVILALVLLAAFLCYWLRS